MKIKILSAWILSSCLFIEATNSLTDHVKSNFHGGAVLISGSDPNGYPSPSFSYIDSMGFEFKESENIFYFWDNYFGSSFVFKKENMNIQDDLGNVIGKTTQREFNFKYTGKYDGVNCEDSYSFDKKTKKYKNVLICEDKYVIFTDGYFATYEGPTQKGALRVTAFKPRSLRTTPSFIRKKPSRVQKS